MRFTHILIRTLAIMQRLITYFGVHLKDSYGFDYGDRRNWYWLQPSIIALYTAQGIPMLYQGHEICEVGRECWQKDPSDGNIFMTHRGGGY